MKYLFLVILSFSFSAFVFAQLPPCNIIEQSSRLKMLHPEIEKAWNVAEQKARQKVGRVEQGNYVVTIPVVVHVIYHDPSENISDAQIFSQIDVLNEDFRKLNADTGFVRSLFKPLAGDVQVEFCLAQRDPNGDSTNGITRTYSIVTDWGCQDSMKYSAYGGADGWPGSQYLNIWVCKLNCANGYAYYPGTPDPYDGVVVHYYVFGRTGNVATGHIGRTATHEVGHYLGLYHSFDYNTCAGSDTGDCETQGDFVCDTPGDQNPDYGCDTTVNDCIDTPVDYPDQIENYMDYSDDPCRVMFTLGQIDRIHGFLFTTRSSLLTSTGCIPPGQIYQDAGLLSVSEPPLETCMHLLTPAVTVSYGGTSPLNSLTISYSVDSGLVQTFSWSGLIVSGSHAVVSLPQFTSQSGIHQILFWCSDPNGTLDYNTGNDTILFTFRVLAQGDGVYPPYSEGFENNHFPPDHWLVLNPNNGYTWQRSTLASGFGTSHGSVVYRNFYNGSTGTKDDLVMPYLEFTGINGLNLSFDVAYSNPNSTFYSDTLKIFSSTDCGSSWQLEYRNGGGQLATAPAPITFSEFIPDSSQWRREFVYLNHLTGYSLVMLRFENDSYWGNDLYIDNINLDITTGIFNANREETIAWPNPVRNQLYISSAAFYGKTIFRLTNSTGMLMREIKLMANDKSFFDVSQLPAGVYNLQWIGGKECRATKIVVMH